MFTTKMELFSPSKQVRQCKAKERIAALSLILPGDIMPLHKGEPDFSTPREICEAANEALKAGITSYPLPKGDRDLRKAIASHLSGFAASRLDEENILITNGSTEAIYIAMAAYLDPGDAVVIFDPCWSLYATIAQQMGFEVVYVPLDQSLRPDFKLLKTMLTPNCRMLIINNPNNPTGIVYTKEEIDQLAEVAVKHRLMVLSDEVYDSIIFDGRQHFSIISAEGLVERTIYMNSFSKKYAMAGWRIGYLAMPKEKIGAAFLLHLNLTNGINSMTQRAALKAIASGERLWRPMVQQYEQRRDLVCEKLRTIPGLKFTPPEGTFYVFCKYGLPYDSATLAKHFIDNGVAVRSGIEFGPHGEGHFRISFCQKPEIVKEGMNRIAKAIARLME